MKWAVAVLLLALLAGCTDGRAPENTALAGAAGPADVAPATGGSIAGILVDPTIMPIQDATIRLAPTGTETTTGAGGRFVFDALPPGPYDLEAIRDGFLPGRTNTQVVAGETAQVKLTLTAEAGPYHTTLAFDWFDDLGVVAADYVVDLVDDAFLDDALPEQCKACSFDFRSDGPVQTFVIEADWQESIESPGGASSYYWRLVDQGRISDYESGYFATNDPVSIGNNRWGNLTAFTIHMYGDETWVSVDQHAELFVTLFYDAPAPSGWSFTAGDR